MSTTHTILWAGPDNPALEVTERSSRFVIEADAAFRTMDLDGADLLDLAYRLAEIASYSCDSEYVNAFKKRVAQQLIA